jgi:DNA primase
MDNQVIQAFKNQIGVEEVLKALYLEYEEKNDDLVLSCVFHEENSPSLHINKEIRMFRMWC